jgi:hypothetical protein
VILGTGKINRSLKGNPVNTNYNRQKIMRSKEPLAEIESENIIFFISRTATASSTSQVGQKQIKRAKKAWYELSQP